MILKGEHMNTLVKAVLFSLSTALVAAPAMAAPQHNDHHKPVHHVQKHKAPIKHTPQKHAKKHVPVKHAPAHHTVQRDIKHR